MANILVSGLINIETTLKVDGFPIEYIPVRYPFFGVSTTVSGVGYNISKALTKLGNAVQFLSLIGHDQPEALIRAELARIGVSDANVIAQLNQTPQSVILYDPQGKRAISTDLKDIQDQMYPVQNFEQALSKTQLTVLANINFSRPMLAKAKATGIPIATDVHTISSIDDKYNRDYMAHADILFFSNERLPVSPEKMIQLVQGRYGTPIIVIGMGGEGALLAVKEDQFVELIPAVYTRPIINTIGAGDSLFSSFVHVYAETGDPYLAIKKAIVFASYKIGSKGGADGFLDADELNEWYEKTGQ